jgi:hypothetical protein
LEKNFEMARQVIRNGGSLNQLPTLDNLEEYANIIAEEKTHKNETTQA